MKRLFDIFGAGIGLIVLAPAFLVLTLLIRLRMGSPVIFKQSRAGLDGAVFVVYKFRSMNDKRDEKGELLPDAERLTDFGRALRRYSLDELPQLWNVLNGAMSLVGPRPLLPEYVPLYDENQRRRLSVKPGITGLAQISGRNAISWPDKFALDVWYVDHQSFWLDIKIIFKTVLKILKREGISAPGDATMPRFMGSASKSHE
ncbi:hypothetical protein AGMMS49957_14750 [Synergistales bacterium]|nr:hypothetical protein AGMMS49957_14750 [Synergistales bacterium]